MTATIGLYEDNSGRIWIGSHDQLWDMTELAGDEYFAMDAQLIVVGNTEDFNADTTLNTEFIDDRSTQLVATYSEGVVSLRGLEHGVTRPSALVAEYLSGTVSEHERRCKLGIPGGVMDLG